MNLFTIESLNVEYDSGGRIIRLEAVVNAQVEVFCSAHGNRQTTLKIQARSGGYDETESLRGAIQQLLNHEYYPTPEYHMPRCTCPVNLQEKMVYDFTSLQEPFRSLFESLFQDSNWTMPAKSLQRLI